MGVHATSPYGALVLEKGLGSKGEACTQQRARLVWPPRAGVAMRKDMRSCIGCRDNPPLDAAETAFRLIGATATNRWTSITSGQPVGWGLWSRRPGPLCHGRARRRRLKMPHPVSQVVSNANSLASTQNPGQGPPQHSAKAEWRSSRMTIPA